MGEKRTSKKAANQGKAMMANTPTKTTTSEPLQHCTECRFNFPKQLTKQHESVCDELRDFANRDDLDELSKRGLFRKQCPFCTEDFCYFHSKSECKHDE